MNGQTIDELLEQEERKAAENSTQEALAKKRNSSSSSDPHDISNVDKVANRSRDPRRAGREDRYARDREENDQRRTRRLNDVDIRSSASASPRGSANGSARDSRPRSRSPDHDHDHRPRSSRDHDNAHRGYRDRRDARDSRSSIDRSDTHAHLGPDRRDPAYRADRDRRLERDDRRGGYDREPRERGIDRAYGGRDDRRRMSPPRRRSPAPRQAPRKRTPEPTDDERDRRTVFVQQLAARLRTRDLQSFFEQVGPVVEAQIVKDRVSGRSKGVGYVEFKDEESVQKAIQLTGQKLLGIPIIAQLTEAEKNRQARTTEGQPTQTNGIPFHRLYVGNIHFSITEEDLKNVFEPFGELEFVQLQKEDQGRSKGYGFVQFIDPTQAKEALEKMNGFELAGRPIRVGLGNDKFTPESTQSLLQRFGSQAQHAQHAQHNQHHNGGQGSSFSGMGGRGAHAGGTGNFDRAGGRDALEKQGGASALDDTDVAGVNFSNYSRDALMRKLARTEDPEPEKKVEKRAMQQVKKAVPVEQPVASRCVLLKNVYNQAEETEAGWQKELEDDIKMECDEKYGLVKHIGLALDNNDGEIYIKFDRVQGGENAFRGLNGRWFGGRMITAQYVVDAVYHMNFPKAANV
ncbi:hypothetical protein LTR62_008063 [Meristemomyces frigidus]|uniref:RRM domain-containing protein n=1 Tax=Meristemomyces frigidus TaxID=1508187 RepID=A0AAN7TH06_9PEZI|nr:hypothetical protein LTR62_008063 [Meristemomyces frigidus]